MAHTPARELNFPNHIYYATETHFRTVRPFDESKKWFYHNAVGGVNLVPVFFDGSDFLQRFDDLDDAVDSTSISISIAFRTGTSGVQILVQSPDDKILVDILAGGQLNIILKDSIGTTIYKAFTTSIVNDDVDHVLAFFYDGILGKGELFLDDLIDENISVEIAGTVDFTAGDFAIGAAVP